MNPTSSISPMRAAGTLETIFPSNCSFAVFTDMDGTLYEEKERSPSPQGQRLLYRLFDQLRNRNIPWGYVSGRDINRIDKAIDKHSLPIPKIVAADVGTSIYVRGEYGWVKSEVWADSLRETWPPEVVPTLDSLTMRIPGAQIQPQSRQGEFKRSYFIDPHVTSIEQVEQHLSRETVSRVSASVHAIVCGPMYIADSDFMRICVDFLPIIGSKGNALEFISRQMDITLDQVFYADDSANGLDALMVAGMATLVGGSKPGMMERVSSHVYISPHPNIYGVIDGLKHYGITK